MMNKAWFRLHGQQLGGLAFFVLVLLGLLGAAVKLGSWLESEENTPISSLRIYGELKQLSSEQVRQVALGDQESSLLLVDVERIQRRVEDMGWVYSVAVRKQWPDKLSLYLVEQQAVAIWNDSLLLNQQGQVFEADMSRVRARLPHFYGPEGTEDKILLQYQSLNERLKLDELEIKELVLSERYAWQLQLNSGVMLNLGREQTMDRVDRFLRLLPQVQATGGIEYADLRYDTGMAIGWKQEQKSNS